MAFDNTRDGFNRRINASATDPAALRIIEAELQKIEQPWAGPLRLRVVDLQRKLSQPRPSSSSNTVAPTAVPTNSPNSWGIQYDLPLPDGRPLHQYRLSTQNYEAIGEYLKTSARRFAFERPHDDALLAIWVAEWFRRCFKGGQQKWADIGQTLGLQLTQAEWRRHADNGLRIWKLAPLRLHGAIQRLLSLARQGGFPVAAIESGGGWASLYLEKLVGVLLGESDANPDRAYAHAEGLGPMLPESWRSSDFFVVCADLALAVVQLRRRAESEGAIDGLSPSLWLDASLPEWRDSLPLVVDGESGRRLVDGLMKAVAVKGGTGAVRVIRTLVNAEGRWVPRVQFELNGKLSGIESTNFEERWSRLRMFAASQLAQYVPGELALVESGERNEWIAVANSGAEGTFEVPLSVPIEVELRGNGQRVGPTFLLANGGAIVAPLLVCYDADENAPEVPKQLLVTGTASGKYRPNPLFVFSPLGWTVEATTESERVQELQELEDGHLLWRVDGGAVVKDSDADSYRILAGQSRDDRDVLHVFGVEPPRRLSAAESMPIVLGKPRLYAKERGTNRPLRNGEAWWRQAGDRDWSHFDRFDGIGVCDFAWRDGTTRHLRDRQTFLVLPEDFCVELRSLGDHAEIAIRGWPGIARIQNGVPLNENRWKLRTRGASEAAALIRLDMRDKPPLELKIQLPHQAWITDWSGRPLAERGRFALADMHRLVARGDGAHSLMGQLRDRNGVRVPEAELRWSFVDELPLNAIRDDVAAVLRPLGDLDATVEFRFNDTRGEYWCASEFDIELTREPRGFVPTRAIVDDDAHIAGRALHQPQIEANLGPFSLASHRPFDFSNLKGAWLLYIRAGQRVLTRPAISAARPLEVEPTDMLGRAMKLADRNERIAALRTLCDEVENDGPRATAVIQSILGLTKSMAGLPASTFDVFGLIAHRSLVCARLMFEVAESEFASVHNLQEGLPLAWSLIPKRHWEKAASLRYHSILSALPETISAKDQLAATAIAARYQLITAQEPATAPLLGLSRIVPNRIDAAQQFMQRAHDRAEHFLASPFRPQLTHNLPVWQFDESYWRALDAPCAAALAAREFVNLDDGQLRCVKDVARRHPQYFAQAFIASFRENSRV